jgi:hypothetical protein
MPKNAPVWELGAGHGLAFAVAADGVFRSADLGRSWVQTKAGLPAGAPGISFLVTEKFVLADVVTR